MSSDRLTTRGLTNVNTSWSGFTPLGHSQAGRDPCFRHTQAFLATTHERPPRDLLRRVTARKQALETQRSGRSPSRPRGTSRELATIDLGNPQKSFRRGCRNERNERRYRKRRYRKVTTQSRTRPRRVLPAPGTRAAAAAWCRRPSLRAGVVVDRKPAPFPAGPAHGGAATPASRDLA